MALSLTEKAKIRLYLGYADQFRYLNSRLESILTDLSPEAEVLVQDSLASLALVEVAMIGTPLENVGIKRIDEVWFKDAAVNTALSDIKQVARPYVARLSIITGVPIFADAFGSQGWPGDAFSEQGGMSAGGGRGGAIRLG